MKHKTAKMAAIQATEAHICQVKTWEWEQKQVGEVK